MTNFFGSVMETIHTDSAYRSWSNKNFGGAKAKKFSDQSLSDSDMKFLGNSNDEDQFNNFTAEVLFPSFLLVAKENSNIQYIPY